MSYDVILFTDSIDRSWHAKPLGAYRLSSELRKHGYSVIVFDFFKYWLHDIVSLRLLLSKIVSDNTLFIGFSGVFFGIPNVSDKEHYDYIDHRRERFTFRSDWPVDDDVINKFIKLIRLHYPHVKLAYGGSFHPKDETLTDKMDYVVTGFGDKPIIELANHLRNRSSLKYMPRGRCKIIDYDIKGLTFDFPNSKTIFELDDNVIHGEVLPMETSRGCLFKCSFCNYPLIGRKKGDLDYLKKPEIITEELASNYKNFGINKYMMVDDTFNETTEKIETLLRARDKSGVDIKFSAYIRVDLLARFPEQLDLLKELGLQSAFLGIESLHWPSAKAVGKGIHPDKVKQTLEVMRNKWNYDVSLHGSFIVGLPFDSPDNIDPWVNWVLSNECPLNSFDFNVLGLWQPHESTDLAKNPEKYGYKVNVAERKWENSYWTSSDASKYAVETMKYAWSSGRLKVGNWDIMGMQNLGYKFNDLIHTPMKDLNRRDIKEKIISLWNDYKNNILNRLS